MSVDGSYEFSAVSPMGETEGNLFLKSADDGSLEGTIGVMNDSTELLEGSFDGDSFQAKCEVKGPMGMMKIKVSGTVDGDKLKGKLDAGIMKIPFNGKRV